MKYFNKFLILILILLSVNVHATTYITKGLIGEEDQNKYDGVNATFTRATSTGGTIILNKVGYEVDALMVYGGGVNYTDTVLMSACTAIGSNTATIILRPGTWTQSASRDYNAVCPNVTFKRAAGAIISHGTYTLKLPHFKSESLDQAFAGSGAVTLLGIKEFYPQWWGWLPDGTDRSTAAMAMINSVYASGGGAVYFPLASSYYRADSQLLIPNNGNATYPAQPSIRFYGAASGKYWNTIATPPSGLDLRYRGTGGKITTLGGATFELDHLWVIDGGSSNTTPFIYATQTVVLAHDNYFQGSTGAQDVFVLGGTGGAFNNTITSEFAGYGTTINNNTFVSVGIATLNYTANGVTITNNSSRGSCGQNRAINLNGSVTGLISGANIHGNLIEMDSYIYGIKMNYTVMSSFYANYWPDATSNVIGTYYSTNSYDNNITLSYASGYPMIAGDSSATSANFITPGFAYGTSTLTLTGCTTAPTTSARWSLVGNVVTIEIDAVTATGSATLTTMTLTGLPAGLTPARTQYFQVYLADAGNYHMGMVTVSGTTLTFGTAYGTVGAFTTNGLRGIPLGFAITYNLL